MIYTVNYKKLTIEYEPLGFRVIQQTANLKV